MIAPYATLYLQLCDSELKIYTHEERRLKNNRPLAFRAISLFLHQEHNLRIGHKR